jgi:hypothetical protein
MIQRLVAITDQCAAIAMARSARTRHTRLKQRLARINLPLQSIVHRVRRGLVLCDEAEFDRHVRAALSQFSVDMVAFVRSLDNGTRTDELLALKQAAMAACEE